jgi:betaine reductase
MNPVIKGAANVLIHVPDFVRHGSKPSREIEKNSRTWLEIKKKLRKFPEAVSYPPNQAFVGNLNPEALRNIRKPWFQNPVKNASRWGDFGEIMPEEEFYALLKISDVYDLVWLEHKFSSKIKKKLAQHQLFNETGLEKIGTGKSIKEIAKEIKRGGYWALPLYFDNKTIGCFQRAPDEHAKEDENLSPRLLMENLITKASAAAALKHLLKNSNTSPDEIDYILSCSEEAVGDRYNRGGGSLAKAIGEMAGCENASGPDIKAFCAAPIYAIVLASSLIKAGVYKKVAVVGGGCLAKIGMKFRGHIASSMPILEDVLGAVAFLITKDDKKSPVINLNAVGKCHVKSGTSQQKVMESLVLKPLKKIKKKITDIDKFAVELHNPEITIPSKTGDVPRKNYEMIAALAVRNKEINREEFENFISLHGMPGFSPSQGHIPAGISFVGHAIKTIGEERIQNAMFVARGSLFLGRMSQLYDGASFVIEKNPAQGG